MNDFTYELKLRSIKLLNLLLITVPFIISWKFYYSERLYANSFFDLGNYVIIAVFMVMYYMFGRLYEAFLVSMNRISEMVYCQGLAAFLSDGVMYMIIILLARDVPNVLPLIAVFIGQICVSVTWSYLAHNWYFDTFPAKKTIIIYDMREGMEELIKDYGMNLKFRVVNKYTAKEAIDSKLSMLSGGDISAVFLCGVHSHDRNIIIKYCVFNGISAYVIPRIGDVIMSGAKRMHMFHLPIMRIDRYNPPPEYVFIKRAFDIIFSLVVIIITMPIMIVTAIMIKRDGGPVLYKQTRLTKNGKKFKVLKFRSMRVDAEKDGIARLSTKNHDKRVTPVGRVIRKYRIDELPQLFNVLSGSMSIVGPRPERPEIARIYEKELPEFALRLQAKAGLTGLAQVYGQYNSTPYDKLQMDLMYISNPSLIEDLRIIFATAKIFFMPESAEGVEEGQTTAMRRKTDRIKDAES